MVIGIYLHALLSIQELPFFKIISNLDDGGSARNSIHKKEDFWQCNSKMSSL